jgi:hypothetical protein
MALQPDGGTDPLPPVDEVVTPSEPLPTPPIPPKNVPPNVNSVGPLREVEAGSRLWMRKWRLTVGTVSGDKAQDISEYDFEFTINQDLTQKPWEARIKIWNLSQNIIARMEARELQKIILLAGYQEPSKQFGQLFAGQIGYYKNGRQNATDTFLEIYGFTSDVALNSTMINERLEKGHSTKDAVQCVVDAMAPHGVSLGTIPEHMGKDSSPRARVLYGNARDCARDIARSAGGTHFIDNGGKFSILTPDELMAYGKSRLTVLNVHTGMTGVPTRTMDGAVEAVCLLNPAIVPGSTIRINNRDTTNFTDVGSAELPEAAKRLQFGKESLKGSLAFGAEGEYPVLHVRHEGQTRGNSWHSSIVCQTALAPQVSPPLTTLGG